MMFVMIMVTMLLVMIMVTMMFVMIMATMMLVMIYQSKQQGDCDRPTQVRDWALGRGHQRGGGGRGELRGEVQDDYGYRQGEQVGELEDQQPEHRGHLRLAENGEAEEGFPRQPVARGTSGNDVLSIKEKMKTVILW